MKRLMAIMVILAMAGVAFAQDVVDPAAEDEAIALIRQQATQLRLGRRDRTEATTALKEMIEARIRVENAWRLVSDALDKGLRAKEMKQLSSEVRLRAKEGLSSEECEAAVKAMVREQVQERTQTASGTTVRTQTRTEAAAGSGAASPSGSGPQTGKGN